MFIRGGKGAVGGVSARLAQAGFAVYWLAAKRTVCRSRTKRCLPLRFPVDCVEFPFLTSEEKRISSAVGDRIHQPCAKSHRLQRAQPVAGVSAASKVQATPNVNRSSQPVYAREFCGRGEKPWVCAGNANKKRLRRTTVGAFDSCLRLFRAGAIRSSCPGPLRYRPGPTLCKFLNHRLATKLAAFSHHPRRQPVNPSRPGC